MNRAAPHDPTCTDIRDAGLAEVKRLLSDFRDRIQILDCDLQALCIALDGPPGAIAKLADEVLDRD